MGQAGQLIVNLTLPLGTDSGSADHHVAAFASDFERITEVRTYLVQRGNYL